MDYSCPIFLLGGPTASGKSALALEWAQQMRAEIVSIDAFQVYQGLNIGTAKPSAKEQKLTRHHLIDLVAPTACFSVADYLEHAKQVRRDLTRRGKPSIWVGGSGLYFRALRQGLCQAPGSQKEVVESLEELSTSKLVEYVRQVDPVWALQADLQNRRRVIRALAVYEQTHTPLSLWQARQTEPLLADAPAFYLHRSKEELKERIKERIYQIWSHGWLEEVERLAKLPGWEKSSSAAALGYRAVLCYLRGQISAQAAIEQIIQETHQFAKRQRTWFRGEKNICLISCNPDEPVQSLMEKLAELLKGSGL